MKPLIRPLGNDEKPHTAQPDEEEQAASDGGGSASDKASILKGRGLTKAKLKGLKGQNRGFLSESLRSGDMDEITFLCV